MVSHPDDEALFFGGLIQTKKFEWFVVCVTNGNADGMGEKRKQDFFRSCRVLGVKKAEVWDYPDIFDKRLDTAKITKDLSERLLGNFKNVFTHGVLGEYGHLHHQDICFAVHSAFRKNSKIFSIAYNTFPKIKIQLTEKLFNKKTKVLWEIYSSESRKLINLLPATFCEGFSQLSFKEVSSIYGWLANGQPLNEKVIKANRWLIPHLKDGGGTLKTRLF